uniref:Uncharacterized protein n=1 Tax=Caudovirales sp. ctaix4 TaxID=2827635 RepID=A0A8S5S5J6_9CAUD|nr:MAG TPA: hypothetical protein [Caudovirales sp. ctaix4]
MRNLHSGARKVRFLTGYNPFLNTYFVTHSPEIISLKTKKSERRSQE